jgi:hypothetical protein
MMSCAHKGVFLLLLRSRGVSLGYERGYTQALSG